MNGKKAAILFVGLVVLVVIATVAAFQIFFATYEPKTPEEVEIINDIEKENQ